MPPRHTLTDEERQAVTDAYQAGERVNDIVEAVGVPRSTIYYILRDAGIVPDRQRRAWSAPDPDPDSFRWLAKENERLVRENERLRIETARLRAELAKALLE